MPATSAWYGDVRPRANHANDYEMDWDAHRNAKFCGIPGFAGQDQAMQESLGPIFDREREYLGASDAGIIGLRKCLLDAARARSMPASRDGRLYRVRPASATLPKDVPWLEALGERLRAIV